MTEEQLKIIEQIQKDIDYFTNVEFSILAEKFKRDLNLIKSLVPKD